MLSAKDISLASLKALVVDCVYRASLTSETDLNILRRFIDCVFSADIFHVEKYSIQNYRFYFFIFYPI